MSAGYCTIQLQNAHITGTPGCMIHTDFDIYLTVLIKYFNGVIFNLQNCVMFKQSCITILITYCWLKAIPLVAF